MSSNYWGMLGRNMLSKGFKLRWWKFTLLIIGIEAASRASLAIRSIAFVNETLPHVYIWTIHWRKWYDTVVVRASSTNAYYFIIVVCHARVRWPFTNRWLTAKIFQEVWETLVADIPANSLFNIWSASTWVASTSAAHCLVSNGRWHAVLVSYCRLKTRCSYIIVLLNILNITGVIVPALILLLVISA